MVTKIDELGEVRPPAGGRPEPPIGMRGMVVGLVLLAALLLGFALWADRQGRALGTRAEPPPLEFIAPAAGEVVNAPLELVFETSVELRRGPAGWQSGGFHLHAEVDGREVMPGPEAVFRLGDGRYGWLLGELPPGERELRLFWSDSRHREVVGSGPGPRVVEVR